MNEFLVTIIFITVLVSAVYFYAGYLTRTGKAEDADGNFIPDSWEEKFGWFFRINNVCTWISIRLCTGRPIPKHILDCIKFNLVDLNCLML